MELGDNEEYESSFVRLGFQSPTQPAIVYDYNVKQRKLNFKSQQLIEGSFDSNNYITRKESALAKDGSKIPISLVYKKKYYP